MTDALIDKYLRELDAALAGVPDAARHSILDDVRAHLADAIAEGRDIDATLAALGSPEEVARGAREELGVAASSATDPAERAGRFLHWAALALAVTTAAFVTFLLPLYTTVTDTEGFEEAIHSSATLFEAMGIGIGLLPLLPAALVLLPIMLPAKARGVAGWAVAAVVTAISIIGGFTIGGFYLPLALLLWGAMLIPGWIRRGRRPVTGRIWRVTGALFIVLPAAWVVIGMIVGTFDDGGVPLWITLFIVFLVGALFAFRLPFIDLIVAVLGIALLLLAVFEAGLLMMAVWWAGGLWLVAGLCGTAARGGIR